MINIDVNAFGKAIRETYAGYDEESSVRQARMWAQKLHPMVENAVIRWIECKRIPDVSYTAPNGDKYSIESIMLLRGEKDYMRAMLLLSEFIKDPIKGKYRIMAPRR